MITIQEYCEKIKNDAYGGSIEVVEDGLLTMENELTLQSFPSAYAVGERISFCADAILKVATSILPLINFVIRCMQYAELCKTESMTAEQAVEKGLSMIREIKDTQDSATRNIGDFGANMLKPGFKVGTFSTSGTVMAILKKAVAQGKELSAICFEARPRSEGFRTFREISELGIPVTFGVDALLCHLMPGTKIFFIGADAVRSTGEVFAKTGSYLAALACRELGVPFYVAADTSKFDPLSLFGFPMKDSSRPKEESYPFEIPENGEVVNMSFELIPPYLISGIITEKGVISPNMIAAVSNSGELSPEIIEKLGEWVQKGREH